MRVVSELGFNLESIKSRPLRDAPGSIILYEVVGTLRDSAASKLLSELNAVCTQVKVLGTYHVEASDG